jgi:photosystem II stability/assembly factor-like uncharacterized protein
VILLGLLLGGLILVSCRQGSSEVEIAENDESSPEITTPAAGQPTEVAFDGTAGASTLAPEDSVSTTPVPEATYEDASPEQNIASPATTEPQAGPSNLPRIENMGDWQRLDTTGGGGQTGIAVHPTDPDIVYMASDNGGLFKTENGGDSWFSVSANLGAYRLGFVTLDPLNPSIVYVTASTDYGTLLSGGAKGEIYRSFNGGLSWEFVADGIGFQNSFPNQISLVLPYDPADPERFDQDADEITDVILVGAWTGPTTPSVGGFWRSNDAGKTFIQTALKDRNVTALHAFATNPDLLFMTTYEGEVYRSADLGESWQDITSNMPLAHPADLAIHPTDENVLYVTCRWCERGEAPVWKTTDGGQNWFAVGSGLDSNEIGGFPRILIDRFEPETLYLTTNQAIYTKAGVYKSTDGGDSWDLMPVRLVLPDGRPHYWFKLDGGLAVAQAVDGRLFADGGAAWRYPDGNIADGRQEWEPATLGIGNVFVQSIEVDPLDGEILYQGIGDFGPYKSVDRGETFHRILGNGWPVTPANYIWNGPYYTNYEQCQLSCSSDCQASGELSVGGTTDFAISNQHPDTVYSSFASPSGGSGHGGINKSTDGGQTWQPIGFQLEQGVELDPIACVPYEFTHLALDPTDQDILFAAMKISTGRTGKLYRTLDGGLTWSEVYTTSQFITGVEVSTINPELVVLATRTEVYKSEQRGEPDSWEVITPPGVGQIQTVRLSPQRERVVVVGTNSQGIYYSDNAGASWDNNQLQGFFEQKLAQDSDQPLDQEIATASNPKGSSLKNVSAIVFDPITPDVFYVGGTRWTQASVGVARVTNAGKSWERLPLRGLAHRNIFDLAIDSQGEYLYAGTFDGTYSLTLR